LRIEISNPKSEIEITVIMAKCEIRISGFGGQGVILAGYILGKAATIYDGKEAVLTQNYGPASRGGACLADLVISDEPINYPKVTAPDVVVALSQEAYLTYATDRPAGCLLLVDEDLVTLNDTDGKVRHIPATRIAEALGRRIVANMVMLGFLAANSDAVSADALRRAIETTVPEGTEKLNLEAFERGYGYDKVTR
jgi:2-oxoglutarate ferredoxin oxidoreductase subunit gamma